jgi:hypothetical protein
VPVCAAARLLRVPAVLHLGNTPPDRDTPGFRKFLIQMRTGNPFVTAYAACSKPVRDQSIALYCLSPKKVHIIPNGIDLERFGKGTIRQTETALRNCPAGRWTATDRNGWEPRGT